jgi:hypothetical protein
MLAAAWDTTLLAAFADATLSVAGANFRSDLPLFAGEAEWNWMAWRSAAHRGQALSIVTGEDWGHRFSQCARAAGRRVHLWPLASHPMPGQAPAIVGDALAPNWVFHSFYQTRARTEKKTIVGETKFMPTLDAGAAARAFAVRSDWEVVERSKDGKGQDVAVDVAAAAPMPCAPVDPVFGNDVPPT